MIDAWVGRWVDRAPRMALYICTYILIYHPSLFYLPIYLSASNALSPPVSTVTYEEEDTFFQRRQQKLPATLFDKLELMVWETLSTSHAQVGRVGR